MVFLFFLFLQCFNIQASQSSSAKPYSNFATNTNNRVQKANNGNATQLFQISNKNIIALYNDNQNSRCTFVIFDPQGTEINAASTNYPYIYYNTGAAQIYWDNSNFLVPLYNNTNPDIGILQRYNYDLTIDTSFGTDGVVSFADPDEQSVRFSTVTKHDNYYYVGGRIAAGDSHDPILIRYTLDGQLDITFNDTGYVKLPNDPQLGRIYEILFTTNYIICRTNSDYLIAISQANPSVIAHRVECTPYSNLELYNDTSFFVCDSTNGTISLYTETLELDTTFNQTGTITFNLIPEIFQNVDNVHPFYHLKKINSLLIAAGEYNVVGNLKFPFVVSYNISNMTNPSLHTSFFSTGYWIPSTYPEVSKGAQAFLVTNDVVPSLFISGEKYIQHIQLERGFSQRVLPFNLQNRLSFYRANNTQIPFLT